LTQLNTKKKTFRFEETADYSTVKSQAYLEGANKEGDEYPLIKSYTLAPLEEVRSLDQPEFSQLVLSKFFPLAQKTGLDYSSLYKKKYIGDYLKKIHEET
jgi:hypothetical protein